MKKMILFTTLIVIVLFSGLSIMRTRTYFDNDTFGGKSGSSSDECVMLYGMKISEFSHEEIFNEKGMMEEHTETGLYNLRYLALYKFRFIAAAFLMGLALFMTVNKKP